LIETKQNAESIIQELEQLVEVDRPIRIHFTGCPNSCGQVQVADIGIMGAPARKVIDGQNMAVPGCKIFVGGRIGEDAHLALDPIKDKIPLDDVVPELVEILKSEFGARDKKTK
jgi:ferredoxin-nitrite reductase